MAHDAYRIPFRNIDAYRSAIACMNEAAAMDMDIVPEGLMKAFMKAYMAVDEYVATKGAGTMPADVVKFLSRVSPVFDMSSVWGPKELEGGVPEELGLTPPLFANMISNAIKGTSFEAETITNRQMTWAGVEQLFPDATVAKGWAHNPVAAAAARISVHMYIPMVLQAIEQTNMRRFKCISRGRDVFTNEPLIAYDLGVKYAMELRQTEFADIEEAGVYDLVSTVKGTSMSMPTVTARNDLWLRDEIKARTPEKLNWLSKSTTGTGWVLAGGMMESLAYGVGIADVDLFLVVNRAADPVWEQVRTEIINATRAIGEMTNKAVAMVAYDTVLDFAVPKADGTVVRIQLMTTPYQTCRQVVSGFDVGTSMMLFDGTRVMMHEMAIACMGAGGIITNPFTPSPNTPMRIAKKMSKGLLPIMPGYPIERMATVMRRSRTLKKQLPKPLDEVMAGDVIAWMMGYSLPFANVIVPPFVTPQMQWILDERKRIAADIDADGVRFLELSPFGSMFLFLHTGSHMGTNIIADRLSVTYWKTACRAAKVKDGMDLFKRLTLPIDFYAPMVGILSQFGVTIPKIKRSIWGFNRGYGTPAVDMSIRTNVYDFTAAFNIMFRGLVAVKPSEWVRNVSAVVPSYRESDPAMWLDKMRTMFLTSVSYLDKAGLMSDFAHMMAWTSNSAVNPATGQVLYSSSYPDDLPTNEEPLYGRPQTTIWSLGVNSVELMAGGMTPKVPVGSSGRMLTYEPDYSPKTEMWYGHYDAKVPAMDFMEGPTYRDADAMSKFGPYNTKAAQVLGLDLAVHMHKYRDELPVGIFMPLLEAEACRTEAVLRVVEEILKLMGSAQRRENALMAEETLEDTPVYEEVESNAATYSDDSQSESD